VVEHIENEADKRDKLIQEHVENTKHVGGIGDSQVASPITSSCRMTESLKAS